MSTPYYGQPINVGSYVNITGTTTGTLIKAGEGALYNISFNNPVATGVITLYDGLSTAGTVIGTITIPTGTLPTSLNYNVFFTTGLFIVVATAGQNITINYK